MGKQAGCRVERAVVHIDDDIVLAGTVIGVDVDDLTVRVKGAVVKRHGLGAVGPQGIASINGVERSVVELSGGVTPVARLADDDAVVNDGLVGTNEAKKVLVAGAHRHVLERNGAGAVKGIVAVVLGTIVCRIGHERTDVPCGLVRTQTLKGKVLALGVALGAHLVERIVTLGEQDRLTAFGISGSGGKILVGRARLLIGDLGDSRSVGICRCNKGAQRKRQRTCHYGDGADPPPHQLFHIQSLQPLFCMLNMAYYAAHIRMTFIYQGHFVTEYAARCRDNQV